MCRICGKLNFDGRPVGEDLVRKMCTVLKHRGPDDEGIYLSTVHGPWSTAQIGLGHRRLSIIDLGGGHQPMSNEDGSVWAVYNGEFGERTLHFFATCHG